MSNTELVEIEKMAPATGRQGTPASGAYGEGADLEALKAQLPPMDRRPDQPAVTLPEIGGPMPRSPVSGNLPRGIFAPSRRPQEPPGTPLSLPPPMAVTSTGQRLQTLQLIIEDPNSSPEFREWARLLLEAAGP